MPEKSACHCRLCIMKRTRTNQVVVTTINGEVEALPASNRRLVVAIPTAASAGTSLSIGPFRLSTDDGFPKGALDEPTILTIWDHGDLVRRQINIKAAGAQTLYFWEVLYEGPLSDIT